MMRPLILASAILVLAGCAELGFGAKTPATPDPAARMSALASRIAAVVEDERLKIDPTAKALQLDAELTKIAEARARDMAAKNYLSHAAPNGDTSASLLMADDAKWQGLLGENLAAQHYVKESGVDVEIFAQRFLDEWIKSTPHRENLAYAGYDRTGVGAAVNGDTVYVAQLFSSDLGLKPSIDAHPQSLVTSYPSASAAEKDSAPPPPPIRLRGAMGGGP
jgi:uncharacterized protein YkwD